MAEDPPIAFSTNNHSNVVQPIGVINYNTIHRIVFVRSELPKLANVAQGMGSPIWFENNPKYDTRLSFFSEIHYPATPPPAREFAARIRRLVN